MDPRITVNGVPISTSEPARALSLENAGLRKVPAWRRLLRRLPGSYGYWQATDPRVTCFDGGIDIYACRQAYLDHDRRWGTDCQISMLGEHIIGVEIRIIEGVYAAGNLFTRFIDAGCEFLGQPDLRDGGQAEWQRPDLVVDAYLADDARNATFRFVAPPR